MTKETIKGGGDQTIVDVENRVSVRVNNSLISFLF